MDPQTQPPWDEDASAFLTTPAAGFAPEGNPADITTEDSFAAGDGGLLEIPLQEHHHQIISAFKVECQRDSLPEGSWKSSSRLPVSRVLQRLAGWLRS